MEWDEYRKRFCASEFRNIKIEDTYEQKVYVFLEKDKNWMTGAISRANFELMSDEYMNLTYLNTVLIQYVLMNRELGEKFNYTNFSSMIPYLNHALEFLKEREKEERALISKYAELPDRWQMSLSEWKRKNNVHKLTDYQAKRFAKYLAKTN